MVQVLKTPFMEELVSNHSAINGHTTHEKKHRLVVDEWGTWYQVEPGTNPGFLTSRTHCAIPGPHNLKHFKQPLATGEMRLSSWW